MPGNLVESSFSRGEVTPELGGRVDIASYKTSLATAKNCIVRPFGGIYNRAGTQHVGFAASFRPSDGTRVQSRLRRFKFNTTDVYILEFSPTRMRVIRNDAYVLDTLKPITGVAMIGGRAVVTIVGHGYLVGDMVIFDDTFVGANLLNGRTAIVAATTTDTISLGDPLNNGLLTNPGTPYVSGGRCGHIYYLVTPYNDFDVTLMSFVQSADVMTITTAAQPEMRLTRTGDADWTLTQLTFAPVAQAPTALIVTPNAVGTDSASYVVTAIDDSTGEESLPSVSATIANSDTTALDNTITWTASAGSVSTYSVYRAVNGIFGFIGDTPGTVLGFRDTNFAPDLSTTPPIAADPFAGGNYPATAMFFQQRLIRAGSTNAPDTLYCSQTGLFYNMTVAQPAVASDALTFTITSREVNQVRHMVPIKQDLIAFTAGQEWRITSNGAAFAAPNLAILPQSSWGSGYLEPISIGLTILYVRENGMMVRSARYTYLSDAYTGEEVSLLSSHMFKPTSIITSWAQGLIPDPVVVCVTGDGQVACLTYQEEQQITAWTRWSTDGAFEAVEIARPDQVSLAQDDEVYFVVNRIVNGNTNVRTVEKIRPRRFTDVRDCFFVDAGLSFDNPITITGVTFPSGGVMIIAPAHGLTTGAIVSIADVVWLPTYDDNWNLIAPDQLTGNNQFTITVLDATSFTLNGVSSAGWIGYRQGGTARKCATVFGGLYHLEGQPVMVLADGDVIEGLTVVDGGITLDAPAARVHIGRQYFTDIETQSLEAPSGSIQGKEARVPYASVRVVDSRGWLQGQVPTDLVEAKLRDYEDVGDPIDLLTGDSIVTMGSDWKKNGTVFIRQPYPLPLEILDIIPALELED